MAIQHTRLVKKLSTQFLAISNFSGMNLHMEKNVLNRSVDAVFQRIGDLFAVAMRMIWRDRENCMKAFGVEGFEYKRRCVGTD
jgi:hypothetical protein